ncbi:MAG: serine/threonine protein kinase [Polyangiaceae bacterium]|nr:serine/threonine protein kinase [Polyangiaceae bacterium]
MKPGDRVDRYVVEGVLGEGGMGVVYRALDERLDRKIALKVVRGLDGGAPTRESTERLLREARAASRLAHPNAVAVHDVGVTDGVPWIAMELVEGRSLRALVSEGPVPAARAWAWLVDVARALSAAHERGIVHRDIKPENVLVRDDGVAKVLDFGIARRAVTGLDPEGPTAAHGLPTLTGDGQTLGTPAYMAPEQIRGEPLDGRVDQFAWGVLAWETLAGATPWKKGDPMALVAEVLSTPCAPIASIAHDTPAPLAAAIDRALEKQPEKRFGSMHELLVAIGGARTPSLRAAPPPRARVEYTDEEVRQIFSRALEVQARERGVSRSVMLEAAREVGIDDHQIELAEQELARVDLGARDAANGRRRAWNSYFRHLSAYAAASVFSIVVFPWVVWRLVVFGWGVGVVCHLAAVVFPKDKRPKRARARHLPEVRRELVEDGAALLVAGTRRLAVRSTPTVDAPPGTRAATAEQRLDR